MRRLDPDTKQALRRFLELISDRYDIESAIVFGSRARETHRPDSDADVAVLLKGEHLRFLRTKLDMADAAFDVLLETGINISPLPTWLDEWERPEDSGEERSGLRVPACVLGTGPGPMVTAGGTGPTISLPS